MSGFDIGAFDQNDIGAIETADTGTDLLASLTGSGFVAAALGESVALAASVTASGLLAGDLSVSDPELSSVLTGQGLLAADISGGSTPITSGPTAAMLAELQDRHRVCAVFELTLDGTDYKFASEPIVSENRGMYLPDLIWGDINRPGPDSSFSLQAPTGSAGVFDKGRVLQKLIGGPAAGEVIGARACVYLVGTAATGLSASDTYLLFDGVISNFRPSGGREWAFELRADDVSLLFGANKIHRPTESDFPDLPTENIGTPGRWIYGEHLSASTDTTGAIEAVLISTSLFGNTTWYIASSFVDDIVAVYTDGVVDTSNWELGPTTWLNGKGYALIWTSDTNIDINSSVTVDVIGITDNSANLVHSPPKVLTHILANAFLGDYPIGPFNSLWLDESTVAINTTLRDTAATYFDDRNSRAALVVSSTDDAQSLINMICANFRISPFWANDWKFGLVVNDPHATDLIQDAKHITDEDVEPGSVSGNVLEHERVTRIEIDWLNHETNGFQRSTFVEDSRRTRPVTQPEQLIAGQSAVAPT